AGEATERGPALGVARGVAQRRDLIRDEQVVRPRIRQGKEAAVARRADVEPLPGRQLAGMDDRKVAGAASQPRKRVRRGSAAHTRAGTPASFSAGSCV